MTDRCEYHGKLCAYADDSPHRNDDTQCPFCHCEYARITAPATETTTYEGWSGKSKKGQPRTWGTVTETRYLFGRGELLLEHLTKHVTDERAVITAAAERARKKRAS